nr:MAG: hypothetical protein DIU67_09015 [Actinomycetota bacterium]
MGGEAGGGAGTAGGGPGGWYVEDHVVVRMGRGASIQALEADAEVVDDPEGIEPLFDDWYTVPVPKGIDAAEFAAVLEERPDVEVAELDGVFELLVAAPFYPNDPWWVGQKNNPNRQWHMHRIDLVDAWRRTVGTGVKVAVIDTGVTPGTLDGFCRLLVDEAEFYGSESSPPVESGPGSAADDDGHGSHVAGTIAQCGDNGRFGTGVAPDASIMPIDVFRPGSDGKQTATASDVARAMRWAIDHGARVINISAGFQGGSFHYIDKLIEEAWSEKIVIVAAAGNNGGAVFYPANHPKVIGVGATGFGDAWATYSSNGDGLDFVAPGGSQSSPVWQESPPLGGWVGMYGTSMAAPHVAGVVALMKSVYPNASVAQVYGALKCTALDINTPGWDSLTGWGLIQAAKALASLGQLVGSGKASCDLTMPGGADRVATVDTGLAQWTLWDGTVPLTVFTYGKAGDIPLMGDWDGDGVATPGLYRQSDGFVYLKNSSKAGNADVTFYFGRSGDIPVVGDFDGDGDDTVSVYRPSTGRFYIKNELKDGWAEYEFVFGRPGDIPFAGDWDGDGTDTVGLRRPSDGFVYLRNSNSAGWADHEFFYGRNGDVVFAGDWDGDGEDGVGVYRPSTGMVYLRNPLSSGNANIQFYIGKGVHPVAGAY